MTGLLSPGMVGLVAAALLAAFMSSADTSLMTMTSILTFDIYKKARPEASTRAASNLELITDNNRLARPFKDLIPRLSALARRAFFKASS